MCYESCWLEIYYLESWIKNRLGPNFDEGIYFWLLVATVFQLASCTLEHFAYRPSKGDLSFHQHHWERETLVL